MSFEHVTCSIKGPPYMADLLFLMEHGHVSCSINSIMPPLCHYYMYMYIVAHHVYGGLTAMEHVTCSNDMLATNSNMYKI